MKSVGPKRREPICLKLWIFKISRQNFGVSVEGYRAKDSAETELCNWRSTTIVERITSVKLVTASGSVYILRGPIDQESALVLGYPKILIDQFKNGFPPDWSATLRRFHKAFLASNTLSTSQWLNSTIIGGNESLKLNRTNGANKRSSVFRSVLAELAREKRKVKKKGTDDDTDFWVTHHDVITETIDEGGDEKDGKEHSENDIVEVVEDTVGAGKVHLVEKKQENLEKSLVPDEHGERNRSKVADVFKVPSFPGPNKKTVARLYNWTFLFAVGKQVTSKLFNGFGLVLEGYREDQHQDWKTSCIVAVEDRRHLLTSSTVYELAGPLNTVLAAQQGFPKDFISLFVEGFPEDWHSILEKFYNKYVRAQVSKVQADEDDNELMGLDVGQEEGEGSSDSSLKAHASSDENDEDSQERRRAPHKKEKKAKSPRRLTRSACKPKKARSRKSVLKRSPYTKREKGGNGMVRLSRSGRVLKAPLASWAGERIVYNVRGSPVKAMGITTESMLSTSACNTTTIANQLGLSPPNKPSQHERTLNSTGVCRIGGHRSGQNARIVDYSSSSSDSSRESGHDSSCGSSYHELLSRSPLTPIRGKNYKHTWHTIGSSSEDDGEKKPRSRKDRKKMKRSKEKKRKEAPLSKKKAAVEKSMNSKKKDYQDKVRKRSSKSMKAEHKEQKELQGYDEQPAPVVSFSDIESEVSFSDLEDDAAPSKGKSVKPVAPRRWKAEEIQRLKLALQAIKPKEDDGWEKIAKSLGNNRTAEECRAEAERKLKWKQPEERDEGKIEEEKLRRIADAAINARVGTVSYQIHAERFTRKFVLGGKGHADFFESGVDDTTIAEMPSVAHFDPDDSLLDVMRTPTEAEIQKVSRRQFVPRSANTDSDDVSSQPGDFSVFDVDSAERERQQRYVYQMLKNKSCGHTSRSKFNFSGMNSTKSRTNDFKLNIEDASKYLVEEEDEEVSDKDEYFDEGDDE